MAADLRPQQGSPEPRERDGDPRGSRAADPAAARRSGLTDQPSESDAELTPDLGTYDAVIIGGGVAGLWTRALLEQQQGRSVALVEHRALGAAQTVASQGILHAGVKYALGGEATEAARAVAEVQATWRDCLAGRGHPDLRAVNVVSHQMHMWTAGAASKLAAWGASKAMRSGVRKLDDRPEAFAGAPKGVAVYEIDESLIDPSSLVAALASAGTGPLIRAGTGAITTEGDAAVVETDAGRLGASRVILCAGAGNESLLTLAGIEPGPLTQRRPLHMVLVRGAPFELNGHCLQMSDVPRLTITSSHDSGEIIWYVGGGIAEEGVERSDEAQIEAAKEELRTCLPWADLSEATWATLRVDRAEARTPGGKRPDSIVVRELGERLIAVWPTKLVLAPVAAQRVAEIMLDDPKRGSNSPSADAPQAPVAVAPWESEGFQWS